MIPGTHLASLDAEINLRNQADQALLDSEQRFRAITENSPIAVGISDADGAFMYINKAYQDVFGYTLEEINQTNAGDLYVDPGDRLKWLATFQEMGSLHNYEVLLKHKDGTPFWASISVAPISYNSQQAIIGSVLDISARKKAEEALAALTAVAETEHQRLVAVMEALPAGVSILDEKGGVVRTNRAFEQVWGSPLPPTEGVNGYVAYKAWWADSGQPVQPEEWAAAQAVQKGKTVTGQQIRIQRFDGTYAHVFNSAAPIFDQQGVITGCAVAIQDITELKRQEKEVRQLNHTLKALSNSNQAMLHATSEAKFLDEVCHIIVKDCNFTMVWIGFLQDDPQQSVKPVASAGFEQGYLEALNISLADPERGSGPTGMAIRTRKPSRCNNMLTDPRFVPWRKAALERGYASSIVLPLLHGDQVLGAINIYSREPDSFSDEEEKLLVELAGDLAYGITTLRLKDQSAATTEALHLSEERYHALFDHTSDGVWIHNLEGVILEVNDAYCQMSGYSPAELTGMPVSVLEANENPAEVTSHIQKLIDQGGHDRFESRHRRKDGSLFDVDITALYLEVEGGRIAIFVRDITERKQAEEAVQRSEAMLRAVLDQMPSGVTIRDARTGELILANNQSREIMGKLVDNSSQFSSYRGKHPDGRLYEVGEWPVARSMATGEVVNSEEIECESSDGSPLYLSMSSSPVRDAKGEIIMGVGIFHDISARKRIESDLRQAEAQQQVAAAVSAERQRFFAVLETLPVMICLLTQDYHVAFANRLFRATFGESQGRHCYEYCYGCDQPCDFCESFSVLHTGQPHHWEVTTQAGKVIDIHDVPFTDVDGTPMILEMDVDITDRRKSEQELQQYRQHLEDLVKERTASLEAANVRLSYLATFPERNPNPVVEVTLDGEVRYANPSALQLFPDLLDAKTAHPWLVGWKTITQPFRRGNASPIFRDVQIGEHCYQQSLAYIASEKVVRIYGIDISLRKQAEEALRKEHESLEQRVQARTLELNIANNQLRAEVAEREKAQEELETSMQELEVVEEELRNNNEMLLDAQKVLDGERKRYQDLFEFAPDAYLVTDSNGRILEANQYSTKLLNIRHQNLLSKPLIVFVSQADHPAFKHLIASLASEREIQSLELKMITRNAEEMVTSVKVQRASELGKEYFLRWTIRDITHRKQAEETIRQNALRNAVLSEVSLSLADASLDEKAVLDVIASTTARLVGDSCIITLVSADGAWLDPVAVNHKKPEVLEMMKSLYGTSHNPTSDGLFGRVFQSSKPLLVKELSPADAAASVPSQYSTYLNTVGISSLLVVPIQLAEKTIGTLAILRDQESQPYTEDDQSMLVILASRTGQAIHNARLYQELQAALRKELETHDQLVQAEKFAAVGRLLASITHEINNPLQTIKNCLYLGEMDSQPGTPLADALAIATAETNRLSNLVAQLREIYRPPTQGLNKLVNLPTILNEVEVLLASYLQDKHVRWDVTPPQDDLFTRLKVEGVPDQVKQVFLNISLNAIDAMEPKGGILKIDFKVNPGADQVGVCFRDTGPGLPPEVKAKLFEPFTTTKEKGLGLGLVICYDIIHKHNGHIDVESEAGHGASFTVWFPARRE